MNLSKLAALKDKAEELRRQRDEASGALNELKNRLKAEFGCATLDEASKLLAKLQKQEKEMGREFEAALAAFERKWSRILEGNGIELGLTSKLSQED